MVTRIAFPTPSSVDIREYPDMRKAEASTSGIATGAVYIFAEITPTSIQVLNLGQMDTIIGLYSREVKRTTIPAFKPEATLLCLDIIPVLAKEANKMAKKTPAKKAPAKKPAAKKPAAKSAGKSGRTSDLVGKKIYKTGKRDSASVHKGSRRSASYAKIKEGMKYETAISQGIPKDDIAKLMIVDHVQVR